MRKSVTIKSKTNTGMKQENKKSSPEKDIPVAGNIIAIDTETTGLHSWGEYKDLGYYPARPFAFSFCDKEGNQDYESLEVDPFTRQVLEPKNWKGRNRMQKVFEDPSIVKVFHNASYDLHILQAAGYKIKGLVVDTLILGHIVTGGSEFTYALKPLAKKYLGIGDEDQKDLLMTVREARRKGKSLGWHIATTEDGFGKEPEKADYWMGDPDLCKTYALMDTERTMLFYLLWIEKLEEYPETKELFWREMELLHVVQEMESRGVKIRKNHLENLGKFYEDIGARHMKNAVDKGFPPDLNPRSSDQLSNFFYEVRGNEPNFTKTYNEKKGRFNYKCNSEVIYKLAETDEVAAELIEFRSCKFAITNFIIPYTRNMVMEKDGYYTLHPCYRQCGPVTGRFSASDPNMMTVASGQTFRTKSQVRMRNRELFGPRKGYIWYLPDFKQMEVWVFAFLAEAEKMIEILLSGKDFHSSIAEEVWMDNPDYHFVYCYSCRQTFDGRENDICSHCKCDNPMLLFPNKKLYRQLAKLIMFCRLYGGGIAKVAQLAKIEYDQAVEWVGQYNERLPEVQKFQERVINRVQKYGRLENPFGRHYFLDSRGAYKGVNYLVQGTCADMMKNSMIRIGRLFGIRKKNDEEGLTFKSKLIYTPPRIWEDSRLLLTIHDEVVCEIPEKSHSKLLMRDIINCMQADWKTLGLPIPIPIDMKISKKIWAEKREVKL